MGKLTAIVFFTVAAVIVFGGCGFVAGDCAAREAAFSSECGALPGIPYRATPLDAQILYESGEFALFAGETVSDTEHNDAEGNVHEESSQLLRNSLFLRRTLDNGKYEWRLLLTTGGDWRDAEPSDKWALSHSANLRCQFLIYGACISNDGRYIWMICNSQGVEYFTFTTICRYEWSTNELMVLCDGHSVEEEADGIILVRGRKTYLSDGNGDPLGAAWYDEWFTIDGESVRKTKPVRPEGL